jgi:hypothetical protein
MQTQIKCKLEGIVRLHNTETARERRWVHCNTDRRKAASIFNLQEQMVETRAWKKMRGLIENDKSRLREEYKETVQHLLAGCQKISKTEYVRRHDNALKVLPVQWAINN